MLPITQSGQGYQDGFRSALDEFPESLTHRGDDYRGGWICGRDDRMKRPKLTTETLARHADKKRHVRQTER
jgi:hypothetical protein